jgi:hypothetical protein
MMERFLKEIQNAEIANKSLAHELNAARAALVTARDDARTARDETQMLHHQRIELGRELSAANSTILTKDKELEALRKELQALKERGTAATDKAAQLASTLEAAQMVSFTQLARFFAILPL